jgi:alkylhydroperoxidase family enzyme
LHGGGRKVDDAIYGQLQSVFDDAALIELFLTAAAFEMFPRFIDGLRIPVTPPAAK